MVKRSAASEASKTTAARHTAEGREVTTKTPQVAAMRAETKRVRKDLEASRKLNSHHEP
jgi:hypothetical protein